ncbi:MAG: Helix-turn-helix domain [Ilumatobacteraceae bacterium]|nr:Helix-turn-helix domain [Ilumatobacteraceae bacterium]
MDSTDPLPANLRRLRTQRGWTYEDTAVATGFDAEVLEGIERGRTFVSRARVALLAERLGVALSALTS